MACCRQIPQWLENATESSYFTFLVSLLGAILSFADPITDILTVVEFYRADQKTWFAVGLAFVIFPCLGFAVASDAAYHRSQISGTEALLCGFHPFSPAWVRLKICWKNFKIWRGYAECRPDEGLLRNHSDLTWLCEVAFESIPQFLIQLYVMNVQQEPVKIIQMISLPVSFLSVVWGLEAADEIFWHDMPDPPQGNPLCVMVTHKVIRLAIYFLSCSQLFAIGFFTVAYKWWMIGVLGIYGVTLLIIRCCVEGVASFRTMIRGSRPTVSEETEERARELKRMKRKLRFHIVRSVLFVIGGCTLILLFYFSPFSNTWYSLPVTVCVCSFSIVGEVLRFFYVSFLITERTSNEDGPTQQNNRTMVVDSPHTAQVDKVSSESTKGDSHFYKMTEYVSYV